MESASDTVLGGGKELLAGLDEDDDEFGGDALHTIHNDPERFQHAAMGGLAFGPLGTVQMLPLLQAKLMGAGS